MYSTTAYLYQQIQNVLLVDTSGAYFKARYDPVYAKPLTINKGVDNVLLFEFINQDQKPVNITGSTFVFRVINQQGDVILAEKEMTILAATLGRVKVQLTPGDTDDWEAQTAGWSIQRAQGDYVQAVFVDADASARGVVYIEDSVYPEFVDSETITIPLIYGPPLYPQLPPITAASSISINTDSNYTPVVLPLTYTSQINVPNQNFHTFRLQMTQFTGNVVVQGAENYLEKFTDVGYSYSYYNESATQYINTPGFFPVMRLQINQWGGIPSSQRATASAVVQNGAVTSINVTSGGLGYLAPPQVVILGAGADASAYAVLNGTSVQEIIVTEGGSGYTPLPPENIGATVQILEGEITLITHR
jgi:hypothetical protein